MLQDLILAAVERRAAQGRRGDGAEDGRHDGRPEDPRPVLMSLPDPLVRLIEELQRLPGIGPKGAQRLAFHILKTPRERDRPAGRRRARRQGARHLLLGLQQHHRRRSVRLLHATTPRPPPHLRRRGAAERGGDREDARVQGRLPRADGRAVAAAGHRARRSEDQGPARARRPAASTK